MTGHVGSVVPLGQWRVRQGFSADVLKEHNGYAHFEIRFLIRYLF